MPLSNVNKYAIALHTSTPQLGIAISNFAGDNRSCIWDLGRGLASQLHQHLREILAPQTWQDLEFIAVAKGPGGFTGTRVGVVTARTIAQQLDIPIYGISNLAAVAAAQNYRGEDLLVVTMDARREKLFVGIYQLDETGYPQTYLEDTLMTIELWQQTLNDLKLPYRIIKVENNLASTVSNVLDLAYYHWQEKPVSHWSDIVPFYGQHPVGN